MAAAFDPAAATDAWLSTLSAAARAKAVAYTQGGHWLLLWGWLVGIAVAVIVLRTGVLARLASRIERRRPRRNLAVFVCAMAFTLISWLLTLPWSAYADWWREKSYGLTSRSFIGWLGEGAAQTLIGAVMSALFFVVLYWVMRRAPRTWWAWASGVAVLFVVLGLVVSPLVIEPLFNRFTPAPAGPMREEVVRLAHASGVPSDKIVIYDGSKQSNRYTAHVSGLFGSAKVSMSDTMFQRGADMAEVRGVLGHEMGHYARGHVLWFVVLLSVLSVVGFFLIDRLFAPAAALLGARDVRGVADPAGLPVIFAILGTLGLLATPLQNTFSRWQETDADRFSLEHAHEPDGLAKALVKTIEYRADSPGAVEEFVFYDHPSVRRRVRMGMDWKAAHPPG